MGHEDKGHFADKHENIQIKQNVADQLQKSQKDNCLTCAVVHRTAKKLNLPVSEVGQQADLLEYQIIECQVGLFGYSKKQKGFDPDIIISDALKKELLTRNKDGRISCRECWDIAKQLKIKRLDVGSACEKMELRIKPCQLGTF